MPVINPDGYQYTFAPLGVRKTDIRGWIASCYFNWISQDRLWRKNRRPNNNGIGGGSCMGTGIRLN